MTKATISEAIHEHDLPESFTRNVEQWYRPISDAIAAQHAQTGKAVYIGVQGCQGSGKSTLCEFLKILLESDHHLNTCVLSIDDFYLTKDERTTLAASIHPLLATRGVPGTHDVQLALNTVKQLKKLTAGNTLEIPRFDKARDDRAPKAAWDSVEGPVDVILLEGWCVGLEAQAASDLAAPVNQLEENEDSEARWRTYANQQLANRYPNLFYGFDIFVVLQAPSFSSVYKWRLLQEQKLIAKTTDENNNHTMSASGIERFVSHYQRLSEHALKTLHTRANYVLQLAEDHQVIQLQQRREN